MARKPKTPGRELPAIPQVKIRSDGLVRNKAVYLALGTLPDGTRDILGLGIENTEGARFWVKVFNDLKTRGVHDILIAVTDGLQGMEQALGAVFPLTPRQTCTVHLMRSSLDYANWKDRKALAAALKPVYAAPSADQTLYLGYDGSAVGQTPGSFNPLEYKNPDTPYPVVT